MSGRSDRGAARASRLRAEDTLFLHAQTPLLCQQVGAVLVLDRQPIGIGDFRAAIRERMSAVPELRRRLERPRSRWRRPCWTRDDGIDFTVRIRPVTLPEQGFPAALRDVVDSFFSVPCDPYQNPWEMLLVHGAPAGGTAVVVKVHHTFGDSHAIIATLGKLFDPAPGSPGHIRLAPPAPRPGSTARAAARTLRGLGHLIAAGTAPQVSVCGPFTSGRRRYMPVTLAAREVAVTARRLRVDIADLLLTMIAEALSHLLRSRGEETSGRSVRAAMPRAQPAVTIGRRHPPANRSAAVSVDLPVGPLALTARLAAISGQTQAHVRRGEAAASAMVLRAMNFLPPPLAARIAAQLYRCRWFNLLVSIFPGVRRSHRLLGVPVREVHPVLALADGAGLAIGAMTWEHSLSIGILADAALVPDVDVLAAGISAAFQGLRAASGQPGDPGREVRRATMATGLAGQ